LVCFLSFGGRLKQIRRFCKRHPLAAKCPLITGFISALTLTLNNAIPKKHAIQSAESRFK
jgi:hypothetical protein